MQVPFVCAVPGADTDSRETGTEWHTFATPHFYIHYQKGDREYAEAGARTAEQVFNDFAPRLRIRWKEKNSVFIYPDPSFLADNPVYGQGEIRSDSGGDVDLFKHRIVTACIPSRIRFRKNVSRLVLRSLIYRRLMGTGGGIMRLARSTVYAEWVVIGTCEYFADSSDPVREGFFRALASKGDFLPLTELYNFDYLSITGERDAAAQSAAMVRWIIRTRGESTLWRIIRRYPRYWSNDRLLKDILGMDQDSFLATFSDEYSDPERGPDHAEGSKRAAAGNARFPADSVYPAVHRTSGRLYFSGERDGCRNVFYLNDRGNVKRVFRETPVREAEDILCPFVIRGSRAYVRVHRFRAPVTARIGLNSQGLVRSIEYSRKAPPEPESGSADGISILSSFHGPHGVCFCICEKENGMVLARLDSGRFTEILERPLFYGAAWSPEQGRLFFSCTGHRGLRAKLFSISAAGSDLRLEADSPWGLYYPAAGNGTLFVCAIEPHQYVIRALPFDSLMNEPAEDYTAGENSHAQKEISGITFREIRDFNPVSSDVVIPGLLWNGSDEYGLNEFWISFGLSTGLVSTSGFEDDSSGAFIAPQLQAEYLHKTDMCNVSLKGLFRAGDVLRTKDYETRNEFTVDLLAERLVNFRLSAGAGIEAKVLERRTSSAEEYEDVRDIGAVAGITFDGVLTRDYLPRRGIGTRFSAARFLESWGSSETYSRFELDTDIFLPVTADSVFQIFGGVYAAEGDGAPEFDLGRERGVLSQPLRLNSGRYMAVARAAYRFPLFRDLNWNLSGVILMRQIRMGIFADAGLVSNEPFESWERDAGHITRRISAGIFFLFDVYPVEGFQMPVVLSIARDPENDTEQIMLEFDFYF